MSVARSCGGFFIAAAVNLAGHPAQAQEAALPQLDPVATPAVERGAELDVSRRHRPEFDPVGIPLVGTWRLYPSVASRLGVETNIYGAQTERASGAFAEIEPSLVASSTFSDGDVQVEASGRFQRYFDQPKADQTSYRFAASGRYDLSGDLQLEGGGEVAQLVEPRDSSGFPTDRVAPVHYLEETAFLHARYQSGIIRTLATVDYTRFDFHDTTLLSPESRPIGTLDQDARDQGILRGSLSGEVAISPGLGLFVQGITSSIHYPRVPLGTLNLSGTKSTALAGVTLGTNQLIRGSIGVGYVWYDDNDASLRSVSGLAVNVDIRYFVTPLLTLSAKASRTVEQAVLEEGGSGVYISNDVSARADYELLRELILKAGVGYTSNTFRSQNRRDRILEVFGGGTYHLNRLIALEIDLSYDRRRVRFDPLAPDFDDLTATVGIRFSI